MKLLALAYHYTGRKPMKVFQNSRIKNAKALTVVLLFVSVAIVLLSFGIGYYKMNLIDVYNVLTGKVSDSNFAIILNLRLSRIIAAYLIGAALSVSGATYQGVLKNPLVSPDILGVASGAGMGAAAAILLNLSDLYIQLFAFAGGILAVSVAYLVSRNVKFDRRVSLILSGMLIGSLAFSVTSMFKYFADTQNQLPEMTHWLMGSLSKTSMQAILLAVPFMAVGFIIIYLLRFKLNVLSLSDVEAKSMGVNTKRTMISVIMASTLLCSAAVCLGGLIGWIGLMVPHITRALVGPQYKKLLPITAMMGGVFLLIMDNIVRSVSVVEIPIGLAISFIGAPFFYTLIRRGKKK